jgi:AAA+ ATPase superfamily predicted ATPase
MKNPFEFGRELGADELVDRQEEVGAVMRTIREGGKLFLIGPRRYGKTSILKTAGDRLVREESAILLRYNAEGFTDTQQLVARIVADAAGALRAPLERVGEAVKKYFQRLQPELSFNATQTSWSAKIGIAQGRAADEGELRLVIDALDGLERLASEQPADHPVGLIIDEFQKLVEGNRENEAQIRAAVQQHARVGYVFAGSKTRLLTDMVTDAARPFYRLGSSLFIAEIPREDFRQFLTSRFAEGGFGIEGRDPQKTDGGENETRKSPVDLILDNAEEVPYNVQMLAHVCWELLTEAGGGSTLTGEVVRRALERLVRQYDAFYTQVWNQQTRAQQKALIACIATGGRGMLSIKITHATRRGPGTIKRALESLVARDILREEESKGQIRYRFEDPFFAKWIGMFTAKL